MLTNAFLRAGLEKARREEADRAYQFCLEMIVADGKAVPNHQHDWKIGRTFSWHYVKIVEYRVEQLSNTLESLMATKKSAKAGKNASFDQYEFVRCELRAEDKKTAKVWIEANTTELGSLLHDAVASDYKFSLSFSSEHDTFTACFTGKPDNVFNPYKTLTARHKDWTVAAMTLLYKHLVMFKGTLWQTDDDTEDDGWA